MHHDSCFMELDLIISNLLNIYIFSKVVTYIQTTNRNSFTLRYKKYKRLRNDIWGRLALRNKKNNITALLKAYGQREMFRRLRSFPREKKKRLIRKLKMYRKRTFFTYTIQEKSKVWPKNNYKFRSTFKMLVKTLRFFYYLRKTRSSLRKLFASVHSTHLRKPTPLFLERRADVLFYRVNFVDTIRQARLFIIRKQLNYLMPKQNKTASFVSQKIILKPYTQIPVFTFFKLSPLLALKRKKILYHALKSRNKLFHMAPPWVLFDYRFMIALLLRNPSDVKYPFPHKRTLLTFMGSARYY